MPATPAWPPKSLPRLFVRQPLGEDVRVQLDATQANYLGNVLRLGVGAELLLFDGSSGEWLARIAEAAKKRITLAVERRTREAETVPDVWLAFAPVKRAQTDWLVEKATAMRADRPAGHRRTGDAATSAREPRCHAPALLRRRKRRRARCTGFQTRTGAAPDRTGGRLYRRGASDRPRCRKCRCDLPRPPHSSRRDRGTCRARLLHGRGR